jgi:membrane associated rhomboid family serine protease
VTVPGSPLASPREPIFNVPGVVLATIGVLVLVHAVRTYGLSLADDQRFLLNFAFFPARYDLSPVTQIAWPGGLAADIWSFVTYAFIHGDWTHLGLNAVWLAAFGSAVARRFGTLRFLLFFVITAAAGAAAHLATHLGDFWPMAGASAAVSGYMAAAIRFVFQVGGPLGWMRGHPDAYRQPAAPLLVALRNPGVMVFLAAWFGLNLLFGVGTFSLLDEGQSIAWQAHLGGFVAGLLLFPLFDPVGSEPIRAPDPDREAAPH